MIAIVVPTIRPDRFEAFRAAWASVFRKHEVHLVTVWDGDTPVVQHRTPTGIDQGSMSAEFVLGQEADLILNRTASCRNLGFAYVARFLEDVETILSLDDDVHPLPLDWMGWERDPIQEHLDALDQDVPVSWMSTVNGVYPRGFPYAVRDEAEVVVSHGVWSGVLDLDAPTQLLDPQPHYNGFYRGVVPKGILAPISSMNLAFKRKALPYLFHAPMNLATNGFDRFDDIWMGIDGKRELDRDGYALVTGYSEVRHTRASNVFENLKKEAVGLGLNETYWQGDVSHPYFQDYHAKRQRWQEWVKPYAV